MNITCVLGPTELGNVDAMSKLPLSDESLKTPIPTKIGLVLDQLKDTPVTADQAKQLTKKDTLLSRVLQFTMSGWPDCCDDSEMPFHSRRMELSTQDGCILWGNRIVVPSNCSDSVLDELHAGHPGVSRMKSLARMFVLCPDLDGDVEERVKCCSDCQTNICSSCCSASTMVMVYQPMDQNSQ